MSEHGKVNQEILDKYLSPETHQKFIEHVKECQRTGFQFQFDVQKLIDGTESPAERAAREKLTKEAWPRAAVEKFNRINRQIREELEGCKKTC
jgi:hypothetical protein